MDIEQSATSAVTWTISKTDYLTPNINSIDSQQTWDGFIDAYTDSSKRKDCFYGRAPVQVKGKKCNDLSKSKIKYPIAKFYFDNFLKDGGAIFFVVYVNENSETKIYYAQLLPFELNKILKGIGEHNSKSITLHEFPTQKDEISNIIINFIRDMNKQVLLCDGKNRTFEDAAKAIDLDKLNLSFSYTCLGYDVSTPYDYLFKHDVYVYAEDKESNIRYAIEHLGRAEVAKRTIEGIISIEGKVFYQSYKILHMPEKDELHIGNSLVFRLDRKNRLIDFKLTGNLIERITDADFFISMLEKQEFIISGTKIPIDLNIDEMKKVFKVDNIKEYLLHLQTLRGVLNDIGVTTPLKIEGLSEKDEEYIRMLIVSFKYGKSIGFEESCDIPVVASIRLSNLQIMLIFERVLEDKYIIKNFFDAKIDCKGKDEMGEFFDTSQFSILTEENFLNLSNLNFNVIEESIYLYENSGHYSQTNFLFLEMLKAYDTNHDKNLIDTATNIAEWLVNRESYEISIVNLYQCYTRQRKLNDNEIDKLLDLSENIKNNYNMLTGIYILLEDFKLAQRYYNKMTKEQQETFKEYPIFYLSKGKIATS